MTFRKPAQSTISNSSRRYAPVIGPKLRVLLRFGFLLFGLLAVNSIYLASITVAEWYTNKLYQEYFYQLMFLGHLLLGFILVLPAIVFGILHMRNAWPRPNYRAVRAGLALFSTLLLLLASGIVLTRFDFFQVKDPDLRSAAYWLHVITPLIIAWLFILHRLAGKGIHYRPAIWWGLAAVAITALTLGPQMVGQYRTAQATQIADSEITYKSDATNTPFFPALVRTPQNAYLPAKTLMMDRYCQECHADTHEKWAQSAHRFSSFNNPAYRFSIMNTRQAVTDRDGNNQASRFCAGCHDLVPLLSGAFDDPKFGEPDDPLASAGITCTGCHAITHINSPRGNADFTIATPAHYPFTFSENGALQWINRQLVKAKPEFHKKTFLKPLHREPNFCGTCHKVHLPPELNDYKWLRGQNHQDAYHLSGVSGHGASSFYYPPKAKHDCAGCHMPLTESGDFGAAKFDTSGQLKIHDHLFLGANTALPFLRGAPAWVNEAHQQFLKDSLRVDIFGLKVGGTINDPLVAPLRPQVPSLVPGQNYLLETVIRTLTLGHLFTQGTADSNEVWLEVTVRSGDQLIGHSGKQADDGTVDPWSHFVNAYLLDKDGNRIDRRNAEDILTPLYNKQIPPGAADVAHYSFTVPNDVRKPISVEVTLKYRKFDTAYMRLFQGDSFVRNDLPVTVIASDTVTFPVEGMQQVQNTAVKSAIPSWQRWNDYGIGLLRKGKRGELRQAESAFSEVEDIGRADGPLNLARVYLKEGRVDDAAAALRRAADFEPPAYPWLLTWFTGLVNKQNGQLDEAIDNFKSILNTNFQLAIDREFDFGQDYRVINQLGMALLERAKIERGDARMESRNRLLQESREWFNKTLLLDPENSIAHYNLALVHTLLGDKTAAAKHRELHDYFRVDDNARDRAVTLHRAAHPAADHAAEAVVIYDLQRSSRQANGAALQE